MKQPQGYIQRRAKHIICSLTPDHEAVKMSGGVWRERHEVHHGNIGHDRVRYPALETAGVLPGSSSAEVAPDAGVDARL